MLSGGKPVSDSVSEERLLAVCSMSARFDLFVVADAGINDEAPRSAFPPPNDCTADLHSRRSPSQCRISQSICFPKQIGVGGERQDEARMAYRLPVSTTFGDPFDLADFQPGRRFLVSVGGSLRPPDVAMVYFAHSTITVPRLVPALTARCASAVCFSGKVAAIVVQSVPVRRACPARLRCSGICISGNACLPVCGWSGG